jgi:hypothetical protein
LRLDTFYCFNRSLEFRVYSSILPAAHFNHFSPNIPNLYTTPTLCAMTPDGLGEEVKGIRIPRDKVREDTRGIQTKPGTRFRLHAHEKHTRKLKP